MKNPTLMLFALGLLAGCTTTVKYQGRTTASPAKPVDYPIYIYNEKVKVPRAFEIIGTAHVGDTPFTVTGGKLEDVLKKLRQTAREKGADALQLKYIKEPGFLSSNFGADAHLLHFTDAWESVSMPDTELTDYFRTNGPALDPIEGVWSGNDATRSRVAIIKNHSKPGRDFVALILVTKNPSWKAGDRKIDLARGERPGVYRGVYYQDDYQGKKVAFVLRGPPQNRFVLQLSEEGVPIIFTRE
jgi:hypothetical protein